MNKLLSANGLQALKDFLRSAAARRCLQSSVYWWLDPVCEQILGREVSDASYSGMC